MLTLALRHGGRSSSLLSRHCVRAASLTTTTPPPLPPLPTPAEGSVLDRIPERDLKLGTRSLVKAKSFLGYNQRASHPESYRYLLGTLGGGHTIIDPDETLWAMRKVMQFLKKVCFRGGRLLFVSSDPTLARLTRVVGEQTGQFYLARRWTPGMLTNWDKGLAHIRNTLALEPDSSGKIKHVDVARAASYQGVRGMTQLPDVIVVLDGTRLHAEPARLNIPVVGVVDSDAMTDDIDYPIPANTKSLRFHHTLAHMLVRAVDEGRALRSELETLAKPRPGGAEGDADDGESRGGGGGGRRTARRRAPN